MIKTITEENSQKLADIQKQINKLKNDLLKAKREVFKEEGLDKKNTLGFLYYKKNKYERKECGFGYRRDYVGKEECVRLVFLTQWVLIDPLSPDVVPRFYTVDRYGKPGNHIDTTLLEDVEFEEANCSLEEAKRILKEVKKENVKKS